ncbi:MAG TPA: tetratricopeptide repeat protein [Candidatus Stackebrandtia faecavium]|nr:tetratricopeptide repeat protein [Candidatus Stackebrandtia faecavium]
MNTPDPRQAPQRLLAGAVDLSGLAQSRPSSQPQADGGAGQGAPTPSDVSVIDVTEATFQSEVLERSLSVPVVIDFWAEWCEPCKKLSPTLEKLANEGGGSWVLAKIDVDANPQLQAAFQVQSIPMVIALWQGRPVDGFQGVQTETTLRQWLAELVKASGGEPPEAPEDPTLVAADAALESGDLDAAERGYSEHLKQNPASVDAQAGLAQVKLIRRVGSEDLDAVIAAAQADRNNIPAALLAADARVLMGDAETAYDELIALVGRTNGDDRDTVRKHLLELFSMAATDDPTVAKARRKLAMVLF